MRFRSVPTDPRLAKYERVIACAGECGQKATVVEPPTSRPLLRAIAGIVQSVGLAVTHGWEFDLKTKSWWCKGCRVRRRLVKAVP